MGWEKPAANIPSEEAARHLEDEALIERVRKKVPAPDNQRREVSVPHPGDKNKHPQPTLEEESARLEKDKHLHELKSLKD